MPDMIRGFGLTVPERACVPSSVVRDNGAIIKVVHAIDMGASGGKIRPIEVNDNHEIFESASEYAFSVNLRTDSLSGRKHIDEANLIDELKVALMRSNVPYHLDPSVRKLITVDTMGSCLKVMSGDYTHEPLTMYTDDQRFRGIQIAADTLTGSDEEALFKMIHSVCGGQSWLDVYNLYHLIAINERNPIPASAVILDIPSVIERYLCGFNPGIESSFLRTSLWGNLAGNALNTEMIEKLGLPVSAFQKVVPSGTLIGETTDLDFPGAQVVAAGTYDTAGAFYALNLMDPNSIFLSSGSWNLVAQPVNMSSIKPDVLDVLFDKRLGIEGATGAEVLVKNVRGTMLFDDLAKELRISNVADLFIGIEDPNVPFALIDLSSGTFHYEQNSGSVTPAINAYCKATEQKIPDTDLAMVKSITMSMVLGITDAVSQFRELSGMLNSVPRSIQAGGGLAMNNYLFDQALADATGLPVNLTLKRLAGFGNAASALIGTDQADRKQVKQSLLNASSDKVFEPVRGATGEWQLLYGQYLATTGQIV